MELCGEYVILRPLRVEDAELTLAWRLSSRAALLNRGATTVAEQADWIASRPATELNFVIELRSGQPVGMLSLVDIDETNRRAEPARFLIAFDRMNLKRVYGTVVADNPLMLKWQKFLGMKEEGRLRQHYFIGGLFRDAICVGMLEDEYRAVALPRMNALILTARGDQPVELGGFNDHQ